MISDKELHFVNEGHNWLNEDSYDDPYNLDHDGADFCTNCGLTRFNFICTDRDPQFANDDGLLTIERVIEITEACSKESGKTDA